MDTFGTYSAWYFEDWMEEWEDYEEEYKFAEWKNSEKGIDLQKILKSKM